MQLRNKESGELSAKHTKFNDIAVTLKSLSLTMGNKKTRIYFACQIMYLALNDYLIIGDTIFMSPTGHQTAILRGHPTDAKVVACSAKGIPSFLSYFKTLSIGPVPRIKPTSFRLAVKQMS